MNVKLKQLPGEKDWKRMFEPGDETIRGETLSDLTPAAISREYPV